MGVGAPGTLGRRERGAGINSGRSARRRHTIGVLLADVALVSGHPEWLCTCRIFMTRRCPILLVTSFVHGSVSAAQRVPQQASFETIRTRASLLDAARPHLTSFPQAGSSAQSIMSSPRVFRAGAQLLNQRNPEHAVEERPASGPLRSCDRGSDNPNCMVAQHLFETLMIPRPHKRSVSYS